jgi:hypothetical protein
MATGADGKTAAPRGAAVDYFDMALELSAR